MPRLRPGLLAAVLLLNGAQRGSGVDTLLSEPFNSEPLRFWVYNDPAFTPAIGACSAGDFGSESKTAMSITLNGVLLGDGQLAAEGEVQTTYTDIQPYLDKMFASHPWRTDNPAEADLFVIPFNVEKSFAAGNCSGSTHASRLEAMLAVLAKSPWYKRNGGSDHFWGVLNWLLRRSRVSEFFPVGRRYMFSKMIVGRYIEYYYHMNLPRYMGGNLQSAAKLAQHEVTDPYAGFRWLSLTDSLEWRCSVQMPIIVAKELWCEESFEEWQKRPILTYFRGKGRGCNDRRNQAIRDATARLQGALPSSLFSNDHAASTDDYYNEVKSSKFCLIFGCDDAQTSRFYDAVAGGCIPVIIDDAYRISVAPYASFMNYDAFTITVPESAWMYDPVLASRAMYGWHQGKLRGLHAGLMAAKKHLSWHHPDSAIWNNTLRAIDMNCMNWQKGFD